MSVLEEIEQWFAMHPDGEATDERQLLSDAADEIERLRKERYEARKAARIMLADKYLLTGEQMTLDELYANHPWLEETDD